MASAFLFHKQNAFSGIEPPHERRKVEQPSRLYDVFINHRGPDVKHTLATQLHNSLTQLGIRAFLDYQEKELGTSFPSAIETAIRSASVHIAIFSKGYAQSPWCLAELLLMLESTAKIIPLFYQVEPWELRHIEKGVYAEAFLEYEEKGRYLEKINEWMEALQSISFTAGYEFKVSDCSYCKEILCAVEKEVQRTRHLHVAKHPVGLHKLVRDFERQCLNNLIQDFESQCGMNRSGKGKANVFSIFGMGGVGKTTLSKELFNQKKSQFGKSSFLFDVREASARAELPDLQSKLLNDLFSENRRFQSPQEGTSCLRDRLERNRFSSFLIVLDDIDHEEQLGALIATDILNKYDNNLVIVTTRDVGVLVRAGIEIGYHLKGLDREDGKELFCLHAFGQPHPRSGYEDLVDTFVNVCAGLPMSLQVLGRHVFGKDPRYWREELKKVSKTLPRDVKKRLKISFDSLDNEEQQVFMDVACFFIDRPKTLAMTIWEGSGWCSHHALETLKDKCLLEEHGFVFRMHDHLRDLGREIAKDLSHPRRVWNPKLLKTLELKGFQNIIAQTKESRFFHSIWDETMGCQITYFMGEPEDSSDTSLLWLQLDYPKRRRLVVNSDINPSIPSWIPLKNLQCLRISGGSFQRLWQSDMQAPSNLKKLQITRTFLEEFPVLAGKLDNMEDVLLDAKEFQMDIWSLLGSLAVNLRSLHVGCWKLSGELDSTDKSLVINNFKLPREGEVALNNEGWSATTMAGVENLEIKSRSLVRKILITGNCCQSLQSLKISKMKDIIEVGLTRILTLNFLEISYCKQFTTLSLEPDLSKLGNLVRVSGIPDLTKLRQLYIKGCPELKELPCLARLCCLEKIDIYSCDKLQSITLPTTISSLSARSCRDLQRVAVIDKFTKLAQLIIEECPQLQELPSLSSLTCMKQIEIYSCGKLKNITFPTRVVLLSVQMSRDLERIAITGFLTKLGKLCIKECPELQELSILSRLSFLKQVDIDSCQKLKKITLPTTALQLSVQACRELQRVAVTGDVAELTKLYINDCPQLEELQSLCSVSCLKEIEIYSSIKIKNITLPTLISLSVRRCRDLQNVAITSDLTKITRLFIIECPKLEKLPGLCRVSYLEQVGIYSCDNLKNIWLPTTLISLSARSCGGLQRVIVAGHLTKLRWLIIADCAQLEELPSLDRVSCLEKIEIDSCQKLQNILELNASEYQT